MCVTVLRAEGHKLTWFNLGIDNLVWENIRYCWWALVSEQGLQRCSDKPRSLWNAASSVNLEALELSSPGALDSVLGSSEADCLGSLTDTLESWLLTLKGSGAGSQLPAAVILVERDKLGWLVIFRFPFDLLDPYLLPGHMCIPTQQLSSPSLHGSPPASQHPLWSAGSPITHPLSQPPPSNLENISYAVQTRELVQTGELDVVFLHFWFPK